MFCFQVRNPGIYLLCRINYVYIYTWTHANAREQERSGVRVQTESGTGERNTPHGRVKPQCEAHVLSTKISIMPALRTLQNRF